MRSLFVSMGLAVLALISCAPASTVCAETCLGCCDVTGECHFGTTVDACGVKGASCSVCASAQSCSAGACISLGRKTIDAGRPAPDSGVVPSVDAGVGADSGVAVDAGYTHVLYPMTCADYDSP